MDLQKLVCGGKERIVGVSDRDRYRTLVNAVMNFSGPYIVWIFLIGCKTVSSSRRTLLHGVRNCVCVCVYIYVYIKHVSLNSRSHVTMSALCLLTNDKLSVSLCSHCFSEVFEQQLIR